MGFKQLLLALAVKLGQKVVQANLTHGTHLRVPRQTAQPLPQFNHMLGAMFVEVHRVQAERLRRDSALESPQAVRDYLKARLRHEPHEVFACLFLDAKHRVLAFEILFYGSIDGASSGSREIPRHRPLAGINVRCRAKANK